MTAGALPRGFLPAIAGGFIAIGLLFGMGGPLWPDLLDSFGVSKSSFGLLSGASLALSFPVLLSGGRFTGAYGTVTVLVASIVMLGMICFGFAADHGGMLAFAALLALRGLGVALVDLAANTLTMDAERSTGRHLMGPMHGVFSSGFIAGAAVVALALALGSGFQAIYALMGGVLIVLVIPLSTFRSIDVNRKIGNEKTERHFREAAGSRSIQICALLVALAFAGEIIIADWTSLYLREDRGMSGALAATPVVAFSVAMLCGRLLNGVLIRAVGVRQSFVIQGIATAGGGLLVIAEYADLLALAGCALTGLGVAGVGPTALSVAGRLLPDDAASAAGVTLAGGYIGLAGAPVIGGLIADGVSTRATMAIVAIAGVSIIVASKGVPQIGR